MIVWAKRAKVKQTAAAQLRRYEAQTLPYAVVQTRSLFGLPPRWLAIRQASNGNEVVIGRHKTRRAAERSCLADLESKSK